MKFSCGRCGKKYATADTPAPGRVYKLKCKACGHLIVVKAGASSAAAAPVEPEASGGLSAPPPPPAVHPEIQLEIDAPEPAAPTNGASAGEVPAAGGAPAEVAAPPAPPPAGDSGYVDLFSDLGGSAAAPLPEKQEDPFLAAARASLPAAYGTGGSAPDPFGPLLQGPRGNAPAAAESAPLALPKIPLIPKPPPQKIGLPIALIGAGVAVLVGILAFVLLGPGKKASLAAGRPAPIQAQAPGPAPAPAPAQAPPAPPPQAPPPEVQPAASTSPPARAEPPSEPRRTTAEDRRQREERRRREREEAQAREARAREAKERERAERDSRAREERDRRERERAERESRAREERERVAAAPAREEAAGGLSDAQIEGVVRSTRKAFDDCLDGARGAGVKLDGRRVMLRLNIQPSGTVTYPTLDDVTLTGTELGSCLKGAARLMVFPKFKGDTMHVEVPLVVK